MIHNAELWDITAAQAVYRYESGIEEPLTHVLKVCMHEGEDAYYALSHFDKQAIELEVLWYHTYESGDISSNVSMEEEILFAFALAVIDADRQEGPHRFQDLREIAHIYTADTWDTWLIAHGMRDTMLRWGKRDTMEIFEDSLA